VWINELLKFGLIEEVRIQAVEMPRKSEQARWQELIKAELSEAGINGE